MPFFIVRNDITKMQVDAIVNAARPSLLGGGGVDGAIHAAAGPELLEECRTLGGCEIGQAKLTRGYRLPARWVIHTVGPVWHGGLFGERKKLLSCYRNSLALAAEQGCESVAFPLISSGAYGYPKDKALDAAREAIEGFLQEQDMTVYLVVYGEESLSASQKLFAEVREYIDREYVRQHPYRRNEAARKAALREESGSFPAPGAIQEEDANSAPLFMIPAPKKRKESAICPPAPAQSDGGLWEEESSGEPGNWPFGRLDESFQQMLLRLIDQRGMTDAECYKRANVDRKHFSKIRSDPSYRPSKPTVIAFAVALRLDLAETEALMRKAGFAFSPSQVFDVIVSYFIEKKDFDIFKINEALYAFDQTLLGA